MLAVPEVDNISVAFGDIKHMPKYETLELDFQRMSHPFCRAVSMWFYKGAEMHPGGIEIDGTSYVAKDGVDRTKALRAIRAILGSFEPKHEHKIAACGFMLSEWFEKK